MFVFDQGLLSIVYIMPQSRADFPDIDASVSSNAGQKKDEPRNVTPNQF